MKQFLLGAIAAVAAAALVAAGLALGGMVDVAADSPHSNLVFAALEQARERAVARAAADISVPADIDDSERVRRGAGNYAAMCANCHLGPGQEDSEIRAGLYPVPPDLTRVREPDSGGGAHAASRSRNAAEDFWVIKHGIKASGMAAWGNGGMTDENIWDLVAFIDALPQMGTAEYSAWIAASDGHSHGDTAMDAHEEHGGAHGNDEAAHSDMHAGDGDDEHASVDEHAQPPSAKSHIHPDGARHEH